MHRLTPVPLLSALAISIALAALAPPASAQTMLPQRLGPYAELQFGGSVVSHSDLDFISPAIGGNVGVFLYPGIGLEAFGSGTLENGEDGRFEAGVTESYGAGLRFQSPGSSSFAGGLLHGYIVLGYVDFLLEQASLDEPERRIEERFSGARISIGVMQRFRRVPNLSLTAEYRNSYVDEPVQVDGLVLGLRLDVR